MNQCHCGSKKPFNECCEPFLSGNKIPETPEELMRSRYSAYVLSNFDYIQNTMHGKPLSNFDQAAAALQAKETTWLGLTIIKAPKIQPSSQTGFVEFMARYCYKNTRYVLHEISEFHRENGRWFYIDGKICKSGRNDLCPCNSGKKYKHCCASQHCHE